MMTDNLFEGITGDQDTAAAAAVHVVGEIVSLGIVDVALRFGGMRQETHGDRHCVAEIVAEGLAGTDWQMVIFGRFADNPVVHIEAPNHFSLAFYQRVPQGCGHLDIGTNPLCVPCHLRTFLGVAS